SVYLSKLIEVALPPRSTNRGPCKCAPARPAWRPGNPSSGHRPEGVSMRRSVKMALLVLALGLVLRAQLSRANGLPMDLDPPIDEDTAWVKATLTDLGTDVPRAPRRFQLSKIGTDVLKQFEKAWTIS